MLFQEYGNHKECGIANSNLLPCLPNYWGVGYTQSDTGGEKDGVPY